MTTELKTGELLHGSVIEDTGMAVDMELPVVVVGTVVEGMYDCEVGFTVLSGCVDPEGVVTVLVLWLVGNVVCILEGNDLVDIIELLYNEVSVAVLEVKLVIGILDSVFNEDVLLSIIDLDVISPVLVSLN